tara:strand:+ start:1033 stop:1860 length:828 start_codon:yes stop_codon:yes gene_type:complete
MREELKVEGFEPVFKGVPPFMNFENGFGYMGVLLEEKETGKLQCHLCGCLALNLAKHIFHKHKDFTVDRYREIAGLNSTTPLMSVSTRKKIKNNFLNLTEEKRKAVVKRLRENNRKAVNEGRVGGHRKNTFEAQNKFGTCPEQAKTLFWEEYKKLGRIPTNKEMSGKLRHIIYTRFSSYKNALISWGVSESEYRENVVNYQQKAFEARADKDFFPKYSEEDVKKLYGDFFFQNKRLPTWGEVKEIGLPGRAPFERIFGKSKSEIEAGLKVREHCY